MANLSISARMGGMKLILWRHLHVDGNDSNLTEPLGPENLGRLLDKHAAALGLYARQLCRCPEDVVQEAFVELVRQPIPPCNLLPWLYRVVRNKALSVSRAEGRRGRREASIARDRPNALVSTAADTLDAGHAAAALKELPAEQREVVVAYLWGGLTFQQIGRLTGTSDSTSHRRYLAALDNLRKTLGVSCPKNP